MFTITGSRAGRSRNAILISAGRTVSASRPMFNFSQTWKGPTTTTNFTAAVINVNPTQSSSTSLILDLQANSSSKFRADKFGNTSVADGGGYWMAGQVGTRGIMFNSGSDGQGFQIWNNTLLIRLRNSEFNLIPTLPLAWCSDTNAFTKDLLFYRSTTATLGLHNATSSLAVSLEIYNNSSSFTNSSNSELAVIDWITVANTLTFGTRAVGTGTVRDFSIVKGSDTFFSTINSSVGGLPAASATLTGARRMITDGASNPAFGSTMPGGGAFVQPVYCDGTTWRYG